MTAQEINTLLDRMRRDFGYTSDDALAEHLNVKRLTLYRWRKGNMDKTKQALIRYLLQPSTPAQSISAP